MRRCLCLIGRFHIRVQYLSSLLVPLQWISLTTCRCLSDVERTMDEWSRRRWQYMLVHQGDFEVKFNECDAKISNCILTFMVSTL